MTQGPETEQVISIRGITKRYGRLMAVKDLRLDVRRGEIFGFLGLNGAGKTTTIRILLDLLRPSGGKAFIMGKDCQSEGPQVRAAVGYLPGEISFYGDMTGGRLLYLLAGLCRRKVREEYRRELQEKLALSESDLSRRLREYSTGMKRKIGLIQAFQHEPDLLILDEPTEGLDPLMQESFYELLFDIRRKGTTIFMSSHVLSEVERVCDRIGLIRRGELVLLSAVDEVKGLAARRVRIVFSQDVELRPALSSEHEVLTLQPRLWDLRVSGPLGPLLQSLAGLAVKDLEVEEPRLEDVLRRYYKEGEG